MLKMLKAAIALVVAIATGLWFVLRKHRSESIDSVLKEIKEARDEQEKLAKDIEEVAREGTGNSAEFVDFLNGDGPAPSPSDEAE